MCFQYCTSSDWTTTTTALHIEPIHNAKGPEDRQSHVQHFLSSAHFSISPQKSHMEGLSACSPHAEKKKHEKRKKK